MSRQLRPVEPKQLATEQLSPEELAKANMRLIPLWVQAVGGVIGLTFVVGRALLGWLQ